MILTNVYVPHQQILPEHQERPERSPSSDERSKETPEGWVDITRSYTVHE